MNHYSPRNLVLCVGSELNGFAGKDSELFWSTGVLECWKKLKPEFQLEYVLIITPLLHHSITPADCRIKERLQKPPLGELKAGSLGPGFFTGFILIGHYIFQVLFLSTSLFFSYYSFQGLSLDGRLLLGSPVFPYGWNRVGSNIRGPHIGRNKILKIIIIVFMEPSKP